MSNAKGTAILSSRMNVELTTAQAGIAVYRIQASVGRKELHAGITVTEIAADAGVGRRTTQQELPLMGCVRNTGEKEGKTPIWERFSEPGTAVCDSCPYMTEAEAGCVLFDKEFSTHTAEKVRSRDMGLRKFDTIG